jgi:hypothetical protein
MAILRILRFESLIVARIFSWIEVDIRAISVQISVQGWKGGLSMAASSLGD